MISWEAIDENRMKVNIRHQYRKITIIAGFTPSENKNLNKKDDFYNKLKM